MSAQIKDGGPVDVLAAFNDRFIPVPEAGCWLWTGDTGGRRGYGRLRVEGRMVRAHRLSWMLHFGPIQSGLCVCHKCDTPSCVNPSHLFLDTNEGNTADRVRKGRSRGADCGATNPVRHERHHQAKLTEITVQAIRELAAAGTVSQRRIAAMFGVSQPCISAIKNGATWYQGRRTRGSKRLARCGGAK